MCAAKLPPGKGEPSKPSREAEMAGLNKLLERLVAMSGFGGAVLATLACLIVVIGWQISSVVQIVAPAVAGPVICGPTTFHTMSEPPETQLTRDYALLKVLLYDPKDHFEQISRLYDGSFRAVKTRPHGLWLSKPSDRTPLLRPTVADQQYPITLRGEARRLDSVYGTALTPEIDGALAARDRSRTEGAFRDMFAILMDELLASVEQKLEGPTATSPTLTRTFQYVHRYYSAAMDAYISLNSPAASRQATAALEAMSRALDELNTDSAGAVRRFQKERALFVRSIYSGIGRTRTDVRGSST